jgi:KaiC/GvpD/RAD55 family RecA-like ATPase
VAIVQFGYLPFKDFDENIDLISNLLRQEEIKRELMDEYQLGEQEIFQFQRIRFLAQGKNNVSRKTLEKMVGEGKTLVELCEQILRVSSLHVAPRPVIAGLETATTKRVLTGYIDLDKLLLGGIPEKYAILLTSSSCDEKDLLIENFLKAGISEGQITLYVTIDVKETANLAEKFPSIFYLFLCNPEADAIIRSLPNVFKLKGVENLNDLDIVLTSFFRRLDKKSKEPRRACIEVVSDALLQHHAVTTRRWLTALIPKFKSRGFTLLAVVNPHMHSPQEVQAILDLFQGEIHIYQKKTEKGLRRFMRIEKMYNQDYDQSELPLKKDRIQKSSDVGS